MRNFVIDLYEIWRGVIQRSAEMVVRLHYRLRKQVQRPKGPKTLRHVYCDLRTTRNSGELNHNGDRKSARW